MCDRPMATWLAGMPSKSVTTPAAEKTTQPHNHKAKFKTVYSGSYTNSPINMQMDNLSLSKFAVKEQVNLWACEKGKEREVNSSKIISSSA